MRDKSTSTRQRSQFSAAYRVLEQAIADHAFPGCAFGVLSGEETVLLDGLGRYTYEHNSHAVAPHTIYDLASVTKVVATAAVAMVLRQRGMMHLDTPLGEVLPAFILGRDPAQRARHVQFRHLLAHTSGLPGYVELFRTAKTPHALMRACLELPLEAEPGARVEYSDPGFILMGKALEVLTHVRLERLVRREVLRPLGMRATGFRPPHSARHLIPPTQEKDELRHHRTQGEVQDENAYVMKGVAGHAGLFSNVPDLLRFASAILNPGVKQDPKGDNARPVFHPDVIAEFARRQPPEGSSRALGWDTPSTDSSSGSHFSPHSIGHLGYSGCSLWIDLDASIAVVLLTNRTWPDRQNQAIRSIRPAFHNAVREAL